MKTRGLCLFVLLALGCITSARKAEQFEWWTRKWETRMGLEEKTQIRIGPTPAGSCGWVGLETQIGKYGPEFFLVTVYDPEKRGCQSPWTIALHEACHRRMQHHHIEINRPNAEAEVAECMEWYR